MPDHDLTVTYYPLSDLRTYHKNPRKGNVAVITASLKVNSQFKPIVVNRGSHTGRELEVLAGNHTLIAARDLGWDRIAAVTVDVDDDQCARIIAADNRSSDLGEYDERLLAELLADLPDLDGTGYDLGDLDELERALAVRDQPPKQTDPDSVPGVPVRPVTQPGDLWLLGIHRLICGDARVITDVDRLLDDSRPGMLLMDPPYGMRLNTDYSGMIGSFDGKSPPTRGKKYTAVTGDDAEYDPAPIMALFDDVVEQFWWGADYYVERIPKRKEGSWLVWDKRTDTSADVWGSEFELCWSRQKHKRRTLRHDWFAFFSSGNTHDIRNRVHPTQKPVTLLVDIIEQWGATADSVLDLYAGSGTTLIAGEQVGRMVYLAEIESAYCDVICRRYQEHTGIIPTRDGVPHDFTA